MKSKSFDLKSSTAEKHSLSDKTIEFVGLYKSVAETNNVADKRKSDEIINKEMTRTKTGTPKRELNPIKNKGLYKSVAETNNVADKRKSDEIINKEMTRTKTGTPKRELNPIKNKKRIKEPIDISLINIDGDNTNILRSSPIEDTKVTSTPKTNNKNQGQVKSIMKTKSPTEQSVDSDRSNTCGNKPKKRNKSVSFMLEDHEEVMVKRTKSNDAKKTVVNDKGKNLKKYQQSEKENKAAEVNSQHMDTADSGKTSLLQKKSAKFNNTKKMLEVPPPGDAKNPSQETKEKKKKLKKIKKQKSEPSTEPTDMENNSEVSPETKNKKLKKKKVKSSVSETTETEGEPAPKSRKKDSKPDIAEDLENLSIGDNAHTLTNLLDEMAVVDKDKRKKLKQKFNKNKKQKGVQAPNKDEPEKNEEVKEKVKWKKRKWNKDKKGDADEDGLGNTVIVENLPISLMLNYRKVLSDHFVKHGLIRKIGIAEMYPTEESKPVFTTTLNFYSDGGAEQALKENNVQIEGSRIRVKRALPTTQTTVVVRSYAELTDQALITTFLGAGKIRNIRHLVKGKKTMATAFVEFDGPEAVERAIKAAGDAKIGGKKIHLSKFEIRPKKVKKSKNEGDSAADADSEDSND